MFTDVYEWLQGLVGVYPVLGVVIIVSALIIVFAATGVRPVGRAPSHSLRPR